MEWSPSFECHVRPDGEHVYRIGQQLVDEFLEFVVGRARPNTVRAYAHDLSVFFSVVAKDPTEVRPKDVMAFVTAQRRPKPGAENVVRIADGSAGLSAATIKRRLAAVSSFYGYLIARDDVDVTPTRCLGASPPARAALGAGAACRWCGGAPAAADPRRRRGRGAHGGAAHRARPGHGPGHGARRAPALRGARVAALDLRLGEWRVFIAEGKGGHERLVPLSPTFFATVARYMDDERPQETTTDALFVSLKGRVAASRCRCRVWTRSSAPPGSGPGSVHGTCHELRHTCFTRLREAGMAIEAIQAQAGHRSITSTRVYLHLDVHWLADEYRRAIEAIEAQALVGVAQ